MVTILPIDVIEIAPEFQTRNDISTFIEYARHFVCESVWGNKAKLGIVLMTAHLMTDLDEGANPGNVTSERVGDLARGYSAVNVQGLDGLLTTTKYGKQFVLLKRLIATTPLVI
jgi:hypothetical protein